MSLPRPLVDVIIIHNIIIMVKSTVVRGPSLARLAMVLVLLSIGNTPARRVITLQAGRSLLYELLFEKEEYFHSTSHYSSRRKNTSTLQVITLRAGRILPLYESLLLRATGVSSTSHYFSRRKNTSTLRVITLQAGKPLLYESFVRLLVWQALPLFPYYSSRRNNTSTLRVITLREGRILPLYESLLFAG